MSLRCTFIDHGKGGAPDAIQGDAAAVQAAAHFLAR